MAGASDPADRGQSDHHPDHQQVPPERQPPSATGREGIDIDEAASPEDSLEGADHTSTDARSDEQSQGRSAEAGSWVPVSSTVLGLARESLARSVAWVVALAIAATWVSALTGLTPTAAAMHLGIVLVLEPLYVIGALFRA